jgi:hypothetical protein
VRGSGGTDPPFSFIFNYGTRNSDCLVSNGIETVNEVWKDGEECEGGQHLNPALAAILFQIQYLHSSANRLNITT